MTRKYCNCKNKADHCTNRDFRDKSDKLTTIINNIKGRKYGSPICATKENETEKKYKKYNYNGSFHKGLQHNLIDGRLVSLTNYERMRDAIVNNDQTKLNNIQLAKESMVKLANPLASICTLLLGLMQGCFRLEDDPILSSETAAAEMVELYCQVIARDVAFIDYDQSTIINKLLGLKYLNKEDILENLKFIPANIHKKFTSNTIYRGAYEGSLDGPYISQLLLLDVIAGALRYNQQYIGPPSKAEALVESFRVEWGINLKETIDLQNGNLSLLPQPTPKNRLTKRYIYNGRSLAEAVHNDPVYQFYYHASMILSSLNVEANSGWPKIENQGNFITNNGIGNIQCILSDVALYALKHSWYWKWQHSRKLRPETFGLWTHDVKSGLVENKDNFDIDDTLLENEILKDIYVENNKWEQKTNSYTLSQAYREGSPIHPSYVSGHAITAGACAAILKIFYNGDQLWMSLPGVVSGILGFPNAIVEANGEGTQLESYNGQTNKITVGGEINKLAFNVAMGRNWAGIHYRSDAIKGILLGEQIAVKYMEDILSLMVENNKNGTIPQITFKNFNGKPITIKPTICY